MAVIDIPVRCSKETAELGLGLAAFLVEVKKAVADGWNPLSDMPAVVSAALVKLVPAMQGVEKVKAELDEDKAAFVNATVLAGSAIVGALLK